MIKNIKFLLIFLLSSISFVLAQDAPEDPYYYLNQLLNYITGYLSRKQRQAIEVYLAEKDYLPPVQLLANDGTILDTSPVVVVDATD